MTCKHREMKCWFIKKYIFNTLVTLVLLYGVDVWGCNIPNSTWKSINKWHTPSYLKIGSLLIEIMAMERLIELMVKDQKSSKDTKGNYFFQISYKIWEMLWTMVCKTLASWCIKSSWTSRITTHVNVYYMKRKVFCLIGHIWPPKTIIWSLYQSLWPMGKWYIFQIKSCHKDVIKDGVVPKCPP